MRTKNADAHPAATPPPDPMTAAEAITKKRQGKKRVNAATIDPTQNYSNKGPATESNSSVEEDSGELKMK